ncbi:HAD-IIB family hydrolase [Corynebacterium sp. H127]|uniref:HAD-IIB family hydrolase n=1 Tax=Corynebacterium sp. H127 TaxID=3133418 RepID=UPI0030A20017
MDAVVFDVDGTICFNGTSVSPEIVTALRSLREQVRVVFASARPIRDLLPVLPEDLHDCALIGGNGAFLRDGGQLTVLGIAREERQALDAIIEEHGLRVLVDGDWDYSFSGDSSHRIFRQLDAGRLAKNVARDQIATYSKVVLFTEDSAVIEELGRTSLSFTVHPDESIIDIAPAGITKHDAIGRLGIADRRYVAFGNDANDVLMLERAGVSYCVGNHDALDFADHHLAVEDVAHAIQRLAISLAG